MADVAEGLGKWPRGKGVGAVALMDEHERGLEIRVREVGVEVFKLRRHEQTLIYNRGRRHRRKIEIEIGEACGPCRVLHGSSGHIEPAFERRTFQPVEGDEHLGDKGHGIAGNPFERLGMDRNIAPAEELSALGGNSRFDDRHGRPAFNGVKRKEDHAHAVGPLSRKRDAQLFALARKEEVGHLHQHAGAVAGLGVAADCPAVG